MKNIFLFLTITCLIGPAFASEPVGLDDLLKTQEILVVEPVTVNGLKVAANQESQTNGAICHTLGYTAVRSVKTEKLTSEENVVAITALYSGPAAEFFKPVLAAPKTLVISSITCSRPKK